MRTLTVIFLCSALVAASLPFSDAQTPATYGGSLTPSSSPPYYPLPSYPQQSSPAPDSFSIPSYSMCAWNGPNYDYRTNLTTARANCGLRPIWLGTQMDALGPDASAIARRDVIKSKYDAICYLKHNMSTPEGKASCRADRENACYPWGGFGPYGGCFTVMGSKAFAEAVCEGSDYQQYLRCISKFVDECGGANSSVPDADGCVWEPLIPYRGAANYANSALRASLEARDGGPLMYGGCFPKQMVDYVLDANGTFSAAKYNQWGLDNLGDATNETHYLLHRGNCSYARMSLTRSQYTAKCKAVNTLTLPSPLDPYLNTIDYSAIAACEAAGCTVKWVDGTLNRNQGYATPESYWTCIADPFITNAKYTYDAATDGKVALAALLCSSPRLQNDQAACEAMVL